jgi:subtilisin family serine protease
MRKKRISFALFVLPLFLFPWNLSHLRFENLKKPSLSEKHHLSSKKSDAPSQGNVSSLKSSVLVESNPLLSEENKKPDFEVDRTQKLKKIEPANFKKPTIRQKKDENSSLGEKIGYLNQGRVYRLSGPRYHPEQVLVRFKDSFSEQMREAAISAYRAKTLKRIPGLDIYSLQIPEGTSVEEMVYVLSRNPDVEFAEPNYVIHAAAWPNDILFSYQYALHNTGQQIGSSGPIGTSGADIRATAAWEETKGEGETIIAIIDTGVDVEHPDIKNKIKSAGKDFVNGDDDATDDNGHGTHVAGIAAADTNNSEGIAGVAWNCKVLPVKVLDQLGEGWDYDVAAGIRWAVDNGADVINLSLGQDTPSTTLEVALEYAYEKNVVIVAAAGNEGVAVYYPAAYDDYCLAVAATNYNDERVTFENTIDDFEPWESNYGPEIDIAAPGERIVGLVPTWYFGSGSFPYAWGFGTSAACPHVAGLAALIKSIKPQLSASEIMCVIRYATDDVNSSSHPGKDDYLGYGRINMKKAIVPIIIIPLIK